MGEARLGTGEAPSDRGDHGDDEDGRHEPRRHDVGQALDGRAAALRLADALDDLREEGVAPDPLCLDDERSGLVERGSDDAFPLRLLDRYRLPRDHRLVDGAAARFDDAVHGDLLARPDPETVTDLDGGQGDVLLAAVVVDPAGRLGRQAEQRLDRPGGRVTRPQFEDLSQEDQGRDHRRRLEIDRNAAGVPREALRDEPREQHGERAERERGSRAHGDQREHVEAAVHDRGPAADEERPSAPQHDRRRQQELDESERPIRQGARDRLAGDHLRHCQNEDRRGQDEADPEPSAHRPEFGTRTLVRRHGPRLEIHAADRARSGSGTDDFRVHRAGVVDHSAFRTDQRTFDVMVGSVSPEDGFRLGLEARSAVRAAKVVGDPVAGRGPPRGFPG